MPPESTRLLNSAESLLLQSSRVPTEAEEALLAELRALRDQVVLREDEVYRTDPWLKTCLDYQEKPYEWVIEHHSTELDAAADFAWPESQVSHDLGSTFVDLIDQLLFRDLGSNTNFAPVLNNSINALIERSPGVATQLLSAYHRNDRLVGYKMQSKPPSVTTFEEALAQTEKRYDLIRRKIAELADTHEVPNVVLRGIWYDELRRVLGEMTRVYIDARTPKDLGALRRELAGKIRALSTLPERSTEKQE
jgi:hypothetical protein